MRTRTSAVLGLAFAAVLALAGCGADAAPETSTAVASTNDSWPRTIEHEAGTTELAAQPTRIVSTSPSITGSLLAIDAPLVASAAAPKTALTDENGFFSQWSDVAAENGVEVLYADLELDLDAIELFEPDLIIGSANGKDVVLDAYDQLDEIADTVLLDYGVQSWQDLMVELGTVTGLEEEAEETIAEYDEWVDEQAARMEVPEQPTTALSYLGADGAWAFGDSSPQADLLTSLGFDYRPLAAEHLTEQSSGGEGVDIVTSENLPFALDGSRSVFIVPLSDEDSVSTFVSDPLLANQEAVAEDHVYSLGAASFRLDYYSAKITVEHIVSTFPAQ